jgi:hypothetical protein
MKYCLALCLLLISTSSHAEVKKWIDAEGKVHYSDMPPVNMKVTTISRNAPETLTPASSAAAPKTLAEREVEWKKSQKAKEEASQKEAQEQQAASIKQKNCENARNNLSILENSPALLYNEKGERITDDATRKQRTEETRQDVSTYCN